MAIQISEAPVESIYPLRSQVLRPGQPIESCHYQEDQLEGVFHLAARYDGEVVAIASFYPESSPLLEIENSNQSNAIGNIWRLRGMATSPDARGQGLGRKILEEGIQQCGKRGARLLWCNARTSAVAFYRKLDFDIKGEEFMIKNIGPHYLMFYQY